jgi:hypothetical protein
MRASSGCFTPDVYPVRGPTLVAKNATKIDGIRAKAPSFPRSLSPQTKTTGSIEPSLLSHQLLAALSQGAGASVSLCPHVRPRVPRGERFVTSCR